MPTVLVTATLNDPSGAALTGNAFVRFKLRGFAGFVPRVSGTSILCETQIDSPSVAGAISQALWGNNAITPANTWYTVEFWNGGRITSSGNYVINGATALNTAAQSNAPSVPSGFLLVLQNNGANNSSQQLLNLESTDASVTITDKGAGTINLQAAGGGGGSSTLAGDTDVAITTPLNGDLLTYDTASTHWKNKPAAGGGGDAGENMFLPPPFTSSDSGYAGVTVICKITANQVSALGASIKLRFDVLSGASVTLVAAVIRRTLPGSITWLDNTAFTWGSSATPTFLASTQNLSDACAVAVDTAHDYYILICVGSSGGANYPKTANPPASYGFPGCGYVGGNQTASSDASAVATPSAAWISTCQVVIAS